MVYQVSGLRSRALRRSKLVAVQKHEDGLNLHQRSIVSVVGVAVFALRTDKAKCVVALKKEGRKKQGVWF